MLLTTRVVVAAAKTKAGGLVIVIAIAAEAASAAKAERHDGRVRGVARALWSARLAMRGVRSRGRESS